MPRVCQIASPALKPRCRAEITVAAVVHRRLERLHARVERELVQDAQQGADGPTFAGHGIAPARAEIAAAAVVAAWPAAGAATTAIAIGHRAVDNAIECLLVLVLHLAVDRQLTFGADARALRHDFVLDKG